MFPYSLIAIGFLVLVTASIYIANGKAKAEKEVALFQSVKTFDWKTILMTLENRDYDSLSYYTLLHGYVTSNQLKELKWLYLYLCAQLGKNKTLEVEKLLEIVPINFHEAFTRDERLLGYIGNKWDQLFLTVFSEARGVVNRMEALEQARHSKNVLNKAIEMMINTSTYEELVILLATVCQLYPIRSEWDSVEGITRLAAMTIVKSSKVKDLEKLSSYIFPTSKEDLRDKYYERMAELENYSDKLSTIVSAVPVGSPGWTLAFNKIKVMAHPEREISQPSGGGLHKE